MPEGIGYPKSKSLGYSHRKMTQTPNMPGVSARKMGEHMHNRRKRYKKK